jgi:hypothetical protein
MESFGAYNWQRQITEVLMRGPTDEEWKHMTTEQRRTYKIFIGIAAFVVAVTFIKKFFF